MQSVEHCDKKKVDCKVSSACTTTATATTTTSSTSVPPSTSKATIANHTASTAASSQSANEKNTMSATEIKLKNKFCNTNTSPIKTVIEKYKNKIQPCDSSESDEESVSEVCYQIRHFRNEKKKKIKKRDEKLYIRSNVENTSFFATPPNQPMNIFLFSVVRQPISLYLSLSRSLAIYSIYMCDKINQSFISF